MQLPFMLSVLVVLIYAVHTVLVYVPASRRRCGAIAVQDIADELDHAIYVDSLLPYEHEGIIELRERAGGLGRMAGFVRAWWFLPMLRIVTRQPDLDQPATSLEDLSVEQRALVRSFEQRLSGATMDALVAGSLFGYLPRIAADVIIRSYLGLKLRRSDTPLALDRSHYERYS